MNPAPSLTCPRSHPRPGSPAQRQKPSLKQNEEIGVNPYLSSFYYFPHAGRWGRADGFGWPCIQAWNLPFRALGGDTHKIYPGLFDSILTKPVKQHRLLKCLHFILNPQSLNLHQEDPPGGILSDSFGIAYPLTILIAEDNLINQKLIEKFLNKLGYLTDIVENGMQVIEALKTKNYNVILMDVQMPEMGGFEATQQIRQMPIEQPYIIAMTANSMSGDRDKCLKAGMDEYISKPMRLKVITDILKIAAENWSKKNKPNF